jgi:hypothetical protein
LKSTQLLRVLLLQQLVPAGERCTGSKVLLLLRLPLQWLGVWVW